MRSEARARLRGLYAVSPESNDTEWLVARVEDCLAGGAALVQYRAKRAAPALALEQARRLALACRSHGATFIVNDSVELALAAGADGVHLGRDDARVEAARAALPAGIIGVSCYDRPQLALQARAAGADYIAIGSVFASRTKPHAARATLEHLAEAKAISGLPLAAIGGIDPSNAMLAIGAGADMVAVVSALFDAADVGAAARSFARLFEQPARNASHVRA
ncbi:MAG: thiamine phosphate synthase [Usitatibacter sp.]